ncbi:hypothetical protein BMS3Abin10_01669 [bacterium BMS3Abin10]|nr:hypothetical protein BMS3Abin10_01669 [bacterium BMS3Abin10]GBE38577.1 hypothetical protein BMS3Bbin08_01184 [bacterium BMS3Bbin08]
MSIDFPKILLNYFLVDWLESSQISIVMSDPMTFMTFFTPALMFFLANPTMKPFTHIDLPCGKSMLLPMQVYKTRSTGRSKSAPPLFN